MVNRSELRVGFILLLTQAIKKWYSLSRINNEGENMKISVKYISTVSKTELKKASQLGLNLLASSQYELIDNVMYEVKYL